MSRPALLSMAAAALVTTMVQASTVSAQSNATVYDYTVSHPVCVQDSPNTHSSASSCPNYAVAGGYGRGSGGGDAVGRTASAAGTLVQTGGTNSLHAIIETHGGYHSTYTVAGTLSQQSYLVFHVNASESHSAVAGSNGTADYSFAGLFLNTQSGSLSQYTQNYTNGQVLHSNDPGVSAVSGGYDFRFANSSGTGTETFNLNAASEEYIYGTQGSGPGTTLSASFSAYVSGIDLVNAQGQLLGSATFDENGDAFINADAQTETTPEPATLSLLGIGLLGIAAARRRIARS